MRKLNIQSILFIGFSFIALIVLLSGLRELLVINNLRSLRSVEIKIDQNQGIVNENQILYKSNLSIIDMIMNSDEISELESLKFKHENNSLLIIENFKTLANNLELKDYEKYTDQIIEIKDLVKEAEELHNKEYLSEYNQVSEYKKNILNFEDYYIENYDLNNGLTDNETVRRNLSNDLNSIILQLRKTSDLLNQKYYVIEQKTVNLNTTIEELILSGYGRAENNALGTVLIIVIFLVVVLYLSIRVILRPISKLQKQMELLTRGELPVKIETTGGIEVRSMGDALNKLVDGLKKGVEFSLEIGKGNFEATHQPLSENDVLGNSLLTLRENLIEAQLEDEKRKEEDSQRNRTNEGLTRFGDILRQHTENISELADDIISNLVKFMNANQGGLFFLNEDDEDDIHYEMIGAFAYNRKKYLSKNIKLGQGLVGSVALEKYTIYMTDIPDEYIEIESGVGSANPRSILLVPLVVDDEVLGVIELASFNTLEEYEVEMVEKIAESIAGSLANARINMQTASLLERSRDQEKLMVDQEKELEQSLEEIKKLTNQVYELESEVETLKKEESDKKKKKKE